MTIEQQVVEKLRDLPPEKQQEVWWTLWTS
jgi:hypothetical protein